MKEFGRILLLIDDPVELAEAAPLFAQLPDQWKVIASRTAQDALDRMEQVPFDIIFVDLRRELWQALNSCTKSA